MNTAAYATEKAKLHDAILEQIREVMMGLHTLNQNLERVNDVGGELQSIAHSWTTFCTNITRSSADEDMGVDNSELRSSS